MSLIDLILEPTVPPPIVAELSGNHNQDFDTAKEILRLAAENGAGAVKLQTYTADSITLPSKSEAFTVSAGLWAGSTLHELYERASTPYEWHAPLAEYAKSIGIPLFSTPFDEAAVDFLESEIKPEIYKISSFEITHIPLLERVGSTGKPVIMSTGMAEKDEIQEALDALQRNGCDKVVLLKCVSAYPSSTNGYHLRSMITLGREFKCPIGLSDHTLSNEVALGATALGARLVEKHFTRRRSDKGIDSGFSIEPEELRSLADQVRTLHSALGSENIGGTEQDETQRQFRRSIYTSKTVSKGQTFSTDNIQIVRPAHGLAPKYWPQLLGKKAARDLDPYSPLKLNDWIE